MKSLRAPPWLEPFAFRLAAALLVVWAVGLAVAAVRLDAWRGELTRALAQMSADAPLHQRIAGQADAPDAGWHRSKALALLAANEKLRADAPWMLFVPGSWRIFDDLEERAAARIEREFGEIVVETIRRELYARAARLTGTPALAAAMPTPAEETALRHAPAPQLARAGMSAASECGAPQAQPAEKRLSAAPEDLPEYLAVDAYLEELEALDGAVRAFAALQRAGTADPQQLRLLVRYTLGAELPQELPRSVRMFRIHGDAHEQPALMPQAIQWAARCTLMKGMGAFYTRLLSGNDLLALEEALAQQSAGLFDPASRAAPFDRTLERYRAVLALLQDQEKLLGQGRNGWMRQQALQLGQGHDALFARIAGNGLLGPEVVEQLQAHAEAAFAMFRRQFDARYTGGAQPGIVWLEGPQRHALGPERTALRAGLAALLEEPFMKEPPTLARELPASNKPEAAQALDEARAWVAARDRFAAEKLGRFPSIARSAVANVVDSRVAELVYQRAFRGMKAASPPSAGAAFDGEAYQREGKWVAEVRALLQRLGARELAGRLWASHTEPLLTRLAALQDEAQQLPLYQPHAGDFAWWEGDSLPLWRAFGAGDAGLVRIAFADQVARLEALGQRAAPLLAAAEPEVLAEASAREWTRLVHELERWRARRADSSLLALEQYLLSAGTDLHRENCAEKLAQLRPPARLDEVAQRYAHLHDALEHRCLQLRATPGAPPALPAYAPFG